MDINEIVIKLQTISDEIAKLNKNEKKSNSYNEVKEYVSIANLYPFFSHILVEKDDVIRKNYVSTLISLIEETKDVEIRKSQLLYIYRIVASYDAEIHIREYITKSLKFDENFWEDLVDLFDEETCAFFAVDMLTISMMNYNNLNYDTLTNILQILKIDVKLIAKLSAISKSIVEQRFDDLLVLMQPTDKINYGYLTSYYNSITYDCIEKDFEKALSKSGKVLIANAIITKYDDVIDLDTTKGESIEFYNCKFKFIKGIKTSKKILFNKCSFEKNVLIEEKKKNGLFGTFTEYEKTVEAPFIVGANIEFTECRFDSCSSGFPILSLKNSKISKCSFIACNGDELSQQYLFNFEDCLISDSTFTDSYSNTDRKDRSYTTGGFMLLKKSTLKNCCFENCSTKGFSSYGSYAHYAMYIVRGYTSEILNCNFKNCTCYSDDSSSKSVTSYIVGITNSSEKNNIFDEECRSYHYKHGDILNYTHYMGSIEED